MVRLISIAALTAGFSIMVGCAVVAWSIMHGNGSETLMGQFAVMPLIGLSVICGLGSMAGLALFLNQKK